MREKNLNIQQQFFRTIIPSTAAAFLWMPCMNVRNELNLLSSWTWKRKIYFYFSLVRIINKQTLVGHRKKEYYQEFHWLWKGHPVWEGGSSKKECYLFLSLSWKISFPLLFSVECKLNDFMIWEKGLLKHVNEPGAGNL
jgi:hypothetical protein